MQDLCAQRAASELVLQQVRDEGAASLLSLRESLGAAHDADRALLLREMAELQRRVSGLRRLAAAESEAAEKRVVEVQVGSRVPHSPVGLKILVDIGASPFQITQCTRGRALTWWWWWWSSTAHAFNGKHLCPPLSPPVQRAVNGEVDRRMGESLVGLVEAPKLAAALDRADKAERDAVRLRAQAERLQEEVQRLQGQLAELGDVRDLTTAAMAGLEATLERIERGAAAGSIVGGVTRPGGARRVPVR